jgi:hypothetical protein
MHDTTNTQALGKVAIAATTTPPIQPRTTVDPFGAESGQRSESPLVGSLIQSPTGRQLAARIRHMVRTIADVQLQVAKCIEHDIAEPVRKVLAKVRAAMPTRRQMARIARAQRAEDQGRARARSDALAAVSAASVATHPERRAPRRLASACDGDGDGAAVSKLMPVEMQRFRGIGA